MFAKQVTTVTTVKTNLLVFCATMHAISRSIHLYAVSFGVSQSVSQYQPFCHLVILRLRYKSFYQTASEYANIWQFCNAMLSSFCNHIEIESNAQMQNLDWVWFVVCIQVI